MRNNLLQKVCAAIVVLFIATCAMPTTAQAQTEYELWVCGTQVTSANCSNLSSSVEGVSGKVSYNPDTKVLMLQDANINYEAGDKAYGFYGLVIAPVAEFNGKKLHVKARFDQYCPNGKSSTAKTLYELGIDCELSRMLKLSAEYAFVNDKALKKTNYNLVDFQLGLRF